MKNLKKFAFIFLIVLLIFSLLMGCTENQYNVSVTPKGEGKIEKSPQKKLYENNSKVELKAKSKEGWRFNYWQGAGLDQNSNNPISLTVSQDLKIKAVFKRKQYNLNLTTEGEGTITELVVYNPTSTHKYGTKVKLTPEPATGWYFKNWSGDISGSKVPYKITIDSKQDITATFYQYNKIKGQVEISNKTKSSTSSNTVSTSNNIEENLNTEVVNLDKNYREGEIIVKYRTLVSNQSVNNIGNSLNMNKKSELKLGSGKTVLYNFSQSSTVKEKIRELEKLDKVKWAEPNYTYHKCKIPNDPLYKNGFQKGDIRANLEAAWDLETGSDTVKVAVVDSGIIPNHPDLQENLLQGADFVGYPKNQDNESPKNYVITDKDPTDETPETKGGSHGTHVAGIIGADGNNKIGLTGVNWNISILPVRVLGADGSGSLWDIAEGVYYAVDQGADIINLSLGRSGDGSESDLEKKALNYAVNNDVVVFAASGNDGDNVVGYPAQYEETIAVGAVNKNNTKSEFSNYGPNLDIVAPGGGTQSDYIYSTWGYYNNGNPTSDYVGMTGTSMATPYVSGIAALLLSHGVDHADIEKRLLSTAVDLGISGKDNKYGYGMVDAYGALLDKTLKKPHIFAGVIKDNEIFKRSETDKLKIGQPYQLNEVENGEVKVFAWRDVNSNGSIDGGDYFGRTDSALAVEEGASKTNIDFQMNYISNSSSFQLMLSR